MDDRGERPGLLQAIGPKEASLFIKLVRAAGPYAREAFSKAKDLGARFTYRQTPSLTRSEFDKFRKEMQDALYEMKNAAKSQQKAQAQSASRLSADNLKLKQMLESLASELKAAMETEAKNGKVSQENVAELTRLVNLLTKRVRELEVANTAKTRSLLADIENVLRTASKHRTLHSRLRDFIAIVTTILFVLGYKLPEKLEGPSSIEDLGKETIDLLSEEYFCGWKLSVFPGFDSDLLISAGQSVLNGVSTSDISAKFSFDNFAGSLTYTDDGNLTTKWSLDKLFGRQGVKCNLHMDYPFNGKLELLSRHRYAALRASVGLTVDPVTSLSFLLGSKGKMLGGSVDIDTAQGKVTSYSYGAKYMSDQCSVSLSVNNLSEITACLHQECWDYTSVGAQLVHSLVTGKTRLSAGVEHAVNTALVMKARGDHTGHVSALGKLQLTPNSSLTMCAEVDVRSIRQAPRVGISFRFDGRRV